MVYTFALAKEARLQKDLHMHECSRCYRCMAKVTSDIHHVAHTYANPIVCPRCPRSLVFVWPGDHGQTYEWILANLLSHCLSVDRYSSC